jgi:hypothetical protein
MRDRFDIIDGGVFDRLRQVYVPHGDMFVYLQKFNRSLLSVDDRYDIRFGEIYDTLRHVYMPLGDIFTYLQRYNEALLNAGRNVV